ncbi:MAG: agmatine/peptidylarginine deiminase [Roseovarius sp.]
MAAPLSALPSGFTVPPEEDRHEATFMMWPVSRRVHPDRAFLDALQRTIADIANTIAAFEPVIMLAHPDDQAPARKRLSGKVTLWDIPTEDLWARDAGPLFATSADGARHVSHIQFNGWGNKQVHARDGQVAAAIAQRLDLPIVASGLHGEPGGVDHDGHGLLMAHESSWVIRNRNPGLSRAQIETRLLNAYGADRMIWAPGLRGQDITDYHIDSLARFTGPGRVLINLPDDPDMSDPFHRAAIDTHDILAAAGLTLTVIPEPVAPRVKSYDFVASYANYYACNGAVIAAQFGDPETDQIATRALKRAYPGRQIVALNVDPLGEAGGGIHCATQQLPA